MALLLWAEHGDRRAWIWIAKPLASLGFILTAWLIGPAGTYGARLMWALWLCALGDVLLIPRSERSFGLGIVAFGMGHLLYAAAFFTQTPPWIMAALGSTGFGVAGYGVWRWLAPYLRGVLRAAIIGYVIVIALMAGMGLAAAGASGRWHIALAATLFVASDLSVARDAFVKRQFLNRAWGLPTYYAAQLLFASTAGQP